TFRISTILRDFLPGSDNSGRIAPHQAPSRNVVRQGRSDLCTATRRVACLHLSIQDHSGAAAVRRGQPPFDASAEQVEEITMRQLLAALALTGAMLAAPLAAAQDGPAKIALIHGLSGSPLEAYSKQTHTGFEMGLEYATKGTMEIKGRKLEIVKKDTQFKADIARALLAEAYDDEDVILAVGETSSGVATAMLPVAAEYQKILLIEPAVADGLTGPDSNRYVFKT